MRVIGGASRGRKLTAPPGRAVRPTSDRVRESIFDILGSMLDLDGLSVLDLFAGAGALGIEALSRGAGRATFVERDPAVARLIARNVTAVGLDPATATVRCADALAFLLHTGRFDLALVDPPYAFDDWATLLERLPADTVVLESDRSPEPPGGWSALGWAVRKVRRYGGTLVTVVRSDRSPSSDDRALTRGGGPAVDAPAPGDEGAAGGAR